MGPGAIEGTYSIEVTNLGAYTTTLSSTPGPPKVTNPATQTISTAATPAYTLTAGSSSYILTPASNTLNALAAAINGTTAANVTATVVNAGTAQAPDYRLSLQSTQLGSRAIGVSDGSTPLVTQSVTGNGTDTYSAAASPAPGPNTVSDPSSQTISHLSRPAFTLTVGSDSYTISPTSNTLASLVDAINSTTGANVRATMVNVGSSTSADYRLSLQSSVLGNSAIQLTDGSINLQTGQVTGSLATYKVNGVAQVAQSDSRTVTIAPGLTVQLLANSPTGQATNITLTRQSSAISDALNAFSEAYNAAVDELAKQRGNAGGALAGNSIVSQLTSTLGGINNYYSGGTGINSLATLGLEMDQTGHMSFNAGTFLSADFSDSQGVTNYLGSSTTGGFLKAATADITQIEDPTNGIIKTSLTAVQSEMTATTDQISTEQARVDALQTSLQTQMASADAAIATMEQQYNYMSQMFQSMLDASQTYK